MVFGYKKHFVYSFHNLILWRSVFDWSLEQRGFQLPWNPCDPTETSCCGKWLLHKVFHNHFYLYFISFWWCGSLLAIRWESKRKVMYSHPANMNFILTLCALLCGSFLLAGQCNSIHVAAGSVPGRCLCGCTTLMWQIKARRANRSWDSTLIECSWVSGAAYLLSEQVGYKWCG